MGELAVMHQPHSRETFERFAAGRSEPGFVRKLRDQSWQRYERLGFPTPRQEQWRLTDLSKLSGLGSTRPLPPASANLPVDAAKLASLPPPLAPLRLVFCNGHFAPGLSRLEALPKGIVITSLAQALNEHAELLETHLDRLTGLEDHPFGALNGAFLEDGAVVYLAPGKVLEQPLQLTFFASGDNAVNYPRNLIVLGEAAEITIVEEYLGSGYHDDSRYLTCPLSELMLDQGAVCRYHKLQQEGVQAHHLGSLRVEQARDSVVDMHLLTFAGLLNRNDVFVALNGVGADCSLHGLTLAEAGESGDYHVCVQHNRPYGTSRQVFKSVLSGKSQAVFDGLIKVVQDAQKTDASQISRNLLLSKQARANANPRLEILADDVKCAHGSTTGFLDPDALFYLRSRGLSEAAARVLLVYAFAHEQIEAIRLQPLRERLEQVIGVRFQPDT